MLDLLAAPSRSRSPRFRILLPSLLLLFLCLPAVGEETRCPSAEAVLDPSRYLILELDGKTVYPLENQQHLDLRFWVLPPQGELKIDFDREEMKRCWNANTQSELSVFGSVSDADGATRAIEIPGYSQVGKRLQLVHLNLHSAREVIQFLYQGSRYAHRVLTWDQEARHAGEEAACEKKKKLESGRQKALDELKVELGRAQDGDDAAALRSAKAVARALAEYDRQEIGDIEQEAETALFFTRLEANPMGEWVGRLAADETTPYLEVIASLIDRNELLIRDLAKTIDDVLKRYRLDKAKLSVAEKADIQRLLVETAKHLLDVEDDLYHHYRNLNSTEWQTLADQCSLPRDFDQEMLKPPALVLKRIKDICDRKGSEPSECEAAERELDAMTDGLQAILGREVINALIDRVSPTVIDLSSLGLQRFDTLRLQVSLLPHAGATGEPIPVQQTFAFSIQPRGWHAPLPTVKDNAVVLVRGKGGEFQPGSGVTAVWNYYGNGRRAGHWLRTLAPGIGFSATVLNFDEGASDTTATQPMTKNDEESVELGLGVTVTLFDNLLSVTYGRNLMATQNGSHEYLAVGISLQQVVNKLGKKE